MAGFVTHRPALPVGTAIAGFPPISRALHVDRSCEVYLLEKSADSNLLLLLQPIPANWGHLDAEHLSDMWAVSGAECLSVEESDQASAFGSQCLLAVLRAPGQWLGDLARMEYSDADATALIVALVDLVTKGCEAGFVPDLRPSLLWLSADPNAVSVTPVLLQSAYAADEPQLVASIARAVYWTAAGIEPGADTGSAPPPLSRWCRGISSRMSALLARCAAPEVDAGRVLSLSALREAIAYFGPSAASPSAAERTQPPETGPASATSAKAGGLAQVAGMHDLKAMLERDVVGPLRNPEPFKRYGLTIPNGVLLYGPPGCGKTYIARQLAEELGYYFVEIIPSETASPYIHQSVLRIRDLFETAAERAPSVIFIDEFEALVPSRSDLGGHQQYKSEEVNEFLAHLGTCAEKGVFVIAATNEPEKIDSAIIRTGRLDKIVYVGPPDAEARAEMLRLHLSGRPVESGLDAASIAGALEGYSASDIRFLVDEAARQALLVGGLISSTVLLEACSRVPPSVTAEAEERYQAFMQRGI
ncbi:MAG TPA: ATP-binding protein [Anaerolineae bacterium]|nr:ATP-binding protein [Anaerolineae bacterium]